MASSRTLENTTGSTVSPATGSVLSSESLEQPKPSNPGWHFVIVTSSFTLGNVFAPFTLATGGWFWGSVVWVYSYFTTWWSGVLIGKCMLHVAARGVGFSYPEMLGDAFGRFGYWFAAVMQIATYYLVNVTFIVNFADWCLLAQEVLTIRGVAHALGLCLWEYLLLGGVITCVLAQLPTFRRVLPFAALGLLSTLARQGILYYQIGSKDLLSECEPAHGGVTASSVFLSTATAAFLFGGHGLFPEEIRELRRPESFFGALRQAYTIIGLVYFTAAYPAYLVWGQWASADIQLNFPLNKATFVSALLSAFWCLMQTTMTHVMMLHLIESHVGLANRRRARWWRVGLRSAVVASETFLAVMFSSAGIGNLQGVVAAFGLTALTYYAPFLAYWKLVLRPSGAALSLQALHIFMALIGIFLTFVGIYAAITGAVGEIDKYRLFDTSRCSIADVIDISSCSNPCLAAYGLSEARCNPAP